MRSTKPLTLKTSDMHNVDQAFSDLGRELGVQVLAPGPSGSVQLRFESGARLGFSCQDGEVVLYWSHPVLYNTTEILWRAFKRAGDPVPGEPAVQVGLHKVDDVDYLVLASRLRDDDCNAREMQQWIKWVRQFADSLQV